MGGLLGDVTDGWFATLAHGAEYVGRGVMNAGSFGYRLGDRFYGNMGDAANANIGALNQQAVNSALASGASPQQAYAQASQHMGEYINPTSWGSAGRLVSESANTIGDAAGTTARNAGHDFVQLLKDSLTPDSGFLLAGAGILGALGVGYYALEAATKPSPTPRRRTSNA